MPGFDRTGPFGEGPMTGRGAGRCGDGQGQGYGVGRGLGRGMRRGGGRRFAGWGGGIRRMDDAPVDEKSQLDNLIDYIADRLDTLKQRRGELDK